MPTSSPVDAWYTLIAHGVACLTSSRAEREVPLLVMEGATMATKTLTAADLAQFTGSENWYRHGLNREILFTDGAQYVAEAGSAYWLLDEIALANLYERPVKAEEFQVWTLTRDKRGNGATLDCGDGNGNTVYCKRIEFTDFPLDTVTFYCEGGTILLPTEH